MLHKSFLPSCCVKCITASVFPRCLMRLIHITDALAEWVAIVSVIIPVHITSISSDINTFSAEITGDMKPSIRALSDIISTAVLLHVKMVLKIIKLHPFHLTKINPAFVTRQWTGKYSSSTARRSGAVSGTLTDTSIHISSPGRKEAWEWNVASHHEPECTVRKVTQNTPLPL